MLRPWLLLLALISFGCAPVATDDDDSAEEDADDDDAAPVQPVEGTWALTLTALTTDDCALNPSLQPGASLGSTALAMSQAADQDFTLTDSDDQIFRCAWTTNPAFTCTAEPWTDGINVLFPDAALHRAGTRSGSFDSPTSAALDNVNVDTCEGAQCGDVEAAGGYAFPCTLAFAATMTQ